MIQKTGTILTYCFLVVLLLLNGTSREFIHEFAGHHDTIDQVHLQNHADHHAAFEPEHHHCTFLTITIPIFNFSPGIFQIVLFPVTAIETPALIRSFLAHDRPHTALRGPPAANITAISASYR